jgi:hypothetical protein
MRKIMNPMFAPSAIIKHEPVIQKYVDKMVMRLSERSARSEETDLVMWFKYADCQSSNTALRLTDRQTATRHLISSGHQRSTKISAAFRVASSM